MTDYGSDPYVGLPAVPLVSLNELDAAAGEWDTVANLLFAAATVSMSRATSMDSNTDKRHGEACRRVALLLWEARDARS